MKSIRSEKKILLCNKLGVTPAIEGLDIIIRAAAYLGEGRTTADKEYT